MKVSFMKDSVMRSRPPRRAVPGAIAAGAFDLSVHFEGLANPTRLAIVELLSGADEMRVSELAELCMVSQPRMSWHLRILRHAQIVTTRHQGREVFCRLDREAIAHQLRSFVAMISRRAEQPGAQHVIQSIEALTPVSEGIS
jgi:DNA-binding transcriptional ArsR family regulator